jgi:hypothetical protein
MLRELCGSDSLKNMMIVTNMWSQEVTEEEQTRERQMRDEARFFKLFLDNHATMVRHDNTIESAHEIIRQICTRNPSPLAIQLETIEEKKTLPSTGAGITLRSGLLDPAQKMQEMLDRVQERLKAARIEGDHTKAKQLRVEIMEMVPGLARLYNELKNLEALTGREMIDVTQVWNDMDSKAQIIAIFRRSYGVEKDPKLNDMWAALGDTIAFFKGIFDSFEECPLPHSVIDQLLRDPVVLTPDTNEKFNKWFSDNQEEVGEIRIKVESLISSKALARPTSEARPTNEEGHANRVEKKEDKNPPKKDNILVRVGARISERIKRSRLHPSRRPQVPEVVVRSY